MKIIIVCLITCLFCLACDDDFRLQSLDSSQLIVEGWIEDGGFPVVILTKSLPVSTDRQEWSDLSDYLIRWAKVTVSDGMDSVVLTGKYDKGYFPPFIYTTGHMKGESGKKYFLSVDYRDFHATAETSIPDSPNTCGFRVERCEDSDTLYRIIAKIIDTPIEKNYYVFFTRVGTVMKQYQIAYLGSFDDCVLEKTTEMPVYRGHNLSIHKYSPYFYLNDTVSIKFAQVNEQSFHVWDSYTKTLSNSGNLFFSTSTDLETNIDGGIGYWCGLNADTRHIVIRDSIDNKMTDNN